MSSNKIDLLASFPRDERLPYDEGLGDLEPDENAAYGKRRIVARIPVTDPVQRRSVVKRQLEADGVAYETLFPTARFWVAVVYE